MASSAPGGRSCISCHYPDPRDVGDVTLSSCVTCHTFHDRNLARPPSVRVDSDTGKSFEQNKGFKAKSHVEPICKLLKTDEPAVRILIAEALGGLGPEGKPAIGPLLEALKDEDLFVRVAVVQALGDIGQFFPQAVEPTLRRLFLEAQEPGEIHAEHLREVTGRVLGEPLAHVQPGVVDQRVDPPEAVERLIHHELGRGGL